jgi:hypothetical protein
MLTPEDYLQGEYETVTDPDLAFHGAVLEFSWIDTDSLFGDTDRFPSNYDILDYIQKHLTVGEVWGIKNNQPDDGRMTFKVLVWRPEDIKTVMQDMRRTVQGRQEWRGEVPLDEEIGDMLL